MKGTQKDAFIPASVFWMVHQDDLSLFQLLVFRFSPTSHRPDPNVATLSQFSPRTLAPKTSGRVWNEMNGLGLDFGQVNPDTSTTINSLIILPREAPTRPAIFNVSRGGTRGW